MKKNLKLADFSKEGDKRLTGVDIDELIPLPPPYDKSEEPPGFKRITEDQRARQR